MYFMLFNQRDCKTHKKSTDLSKNEMKGFILLIFLSLIMSCQNGEMRIPEHPAMKGLALPLYLSTDSLRIHLQDYFPVPAKVKKIHLSEGLDMVRDKEQGTLDIFITDTTRNLFNIRMKYEDYTYDIPVIREDRTGDSLQILTDEWRDDTVFLCSSAPVEEWVVYFDNYKLNDEALIASDSCLGILLPAAASLLDFAELRVWASDGKYVTHCRSIPVRKGKLILEVTDLDSLDTRVIAWNQKIMCYNVMKDTAREELVELLSNSAKAFTIPADSCRISLDSVDVQNRKYVECFLNNLALMYGDYIPLRSGKGIFAYLRSYFGKEVIVVVNKEKETTTFKLDLPRKFRETDFKSLENNRFSYDNAKLILDVPANRAEVIYN